MIDALSAPSSALDAMSVQVAAAAGNIANLDTDGYQAQRVNLATADDGQGVQVASVTRDTSPGSVRPDTSAPTRDSADISEAGRTMAETSNVDPVRETLSMMEASRGFEANVAVIRTQDAMAGALLDMRV
jgi:flagellar basal-body rod protein FlgC